MVPPRREIRVAVAAKTLARDACLGSIAAIAITTEASQDSGIPTPGITAPTAVGSSAGLSLFAALLVLGVQRSNLLSTQHELRGERCTA